MPYIEVSNGELIDKWTILEIKLSALQDHSQIQNVKMEMSALSSEVTELLGKSDILKYKNSLFEVNNAIWNLMNLLYQMGSDGGERYVKITMDITKLNQDRAFIKRQIDLTCHSNFREAKSYFEQNGLVIE